MLRAIEDYQGALETKAALELLALTFVRPGELRAPMGEIRPRRGGVGNSGRANEDAEHASGPTRNSRVGGPK
jgi:hypothetical protein